MMRRVGTLCVWRDGRSRRPQNCVWLLCLAARCDQPTVETQCYGEVGFRCLDEKAVVSTSLMKAQCGLPQMHLLLCITRRACAQPLSSTCSLKSCSHKQSQSYILSSQVVVGCACHFPLKITLFRDNVYILFALSTQRSNKRRHF